MQPAERLAVIGDPVAHSLSPALHGAALRRAGLRWSYGAHRVGSAELPAWVQWARAAGYVGFNVTIPHKRAVIALLDSLHDGARAVGAVNTVVCRGGGLVGYNTDVEGFRALRAKAGFVAEGPQVVIFGAGGAARAVVCALGDQADAITIVSRHPRRAEDWPPSWPVRVCSYGDAALRDTVEQADLLVNATPLGLADLSLESPLPPGSRLKSDTVVVDLIYGRVTPFMSSAREQGCRAIDGLEMLLGQGAAAFRLWTGMEPDVGAMRAACSSALEAPSC